MAPPAALPRAASAAPALLASSSAEPGLQAIRCTPYGCCRPASSHMQPACSWRPPQSTAAHTGASQHTKHTTPTLAAHPASQHCPAAGDTLARDALMSLLQSQGEPLSEDELHVALAALTGAAEPLESLPEMMGPQLFCADVLGLAAAAEQE